MQLSLRTLIVGVTSVALAAALYGYLGWDGVFLSILCTYAAISAWKSRDQLDRAIGCAVLVALGAQLLIALAS